MWVSQLPKHQTFHPHTLTHTHHAASQACCDHVLSLLCKGSSVTAGSAACCTQTQPVLQGPGNSWTLSRSHCVSQCCCNRSVPPVLRMVCLLPDGQPAGHRWLQPHTLPPSIVGSILCLPCAQCMLHCVPAIKCTLTFLPGWPCGGNARPCDNSTLPSTVTRLKHLAESCNTSRHPQHTHNETQLHSLLPHETVLT